MGFSFDDSRWPLVEFTFRGRMTEVDNSAYLRRSDGLIADGRPYLVVVDASEMLLPEAHFMRQQVTWIRRNKQVLTALNRGMAFVAPNAMTRGILKALRHLEPTSIVFEVCDDVESARSWCEHRAQKLNLGAG